MARADEEVTYGLGLHVAFWAGVGVGQADAVAEVLKSSAVIGAHLGQGGAVCSREGPFGVVNVGWGGV